MVYQDIKSSTYKAKEASILEQLAQAQKSQDVLEEAGNTEEAKKFDDKIQGYNMELNRLSTGAQNKRKVVRIPKEDEASVAQQLGGIEAIKQRVGVQNNTTQTNDPLGIFE